MRTQSCCRMLPLLLALVLLGKPAICTSSSPLEATTTNHGRAWSTVQAHLSPGPQLDAFISARARKTGTTIVGVVCEGGVVLGADTRATNDRTVADKNCEKIHKLASNIYCCGAGTSADCERLTLETRLRLMEFTRAAHAAPVCATHCYLALLVSAAAAAAEHCCFAVVLLSKRRQAQSVYHDPSAAGPVDTDAAQRSHCRVEMAHRLLKNALYQNGGEISAAFVLGGVDTAGAHLYALHPHGSSDKGPFAALGSGSLAAMSVLESEYREGLSVAAARDLVCLAISAGIDNDLGSGSNVDLCVLHADGAVEYTRAYRSQATPAPIDSAGPAAARASATAALRRRKAAAARQATAVGAADAVADGAGVGGAGEAAAAVEGVEAAAWRETLRPALRSVASVGGARMQLRVDDTIEIL